MWSRSEWRSVRHNWSRSKTAVKKIWKKKDFLPVQMPNKLWKSDEPIRIVFLCILLNKIKNGNSMSQWFRSSFLLLYYEKIHELHRDYIVITHDEYLVKSYQQPLAKDCTPKDQYLPIRFSSRKVNNRCHSNYAKRLEIVLMYGVDRKCHVTWSGHHYVILQYQSNMY